MVVNAPVWRLAGRTRRQGDMHRSKYDDADVNPLHYHTLLSKSGLRVLSRVCDCVAHRQLHATLFPFIA